MRHLLFILAALLLCAAPLHAQTIKTLGFNSTNGQVVANTGTNVLTFTNDVRVGTNNSITLDQYGITGWGSGISLEERSFRDETVVALTWSSSGVGFWVPITFDDAGAQGPSRANLGFSTNLNTLWTASNAATAARALSGSTNTNHPYSGTVALTNTNAVLTFSNGILQSVQ